MTISVSVYSEIHNAPCGEMNKLNSERLTQVSGVSIAKLLFFKVGKPENI